MSYEYPLADGTTLVCAFGYDPDEIDAGSIASVENALRQCAPEVEVVSVGTHDWAGAEFPDGAGSIWDPKWVASGYESALEAPHWRIYFADSDVAKSWSGWTGGAICSGADTAGRVRDSLHAAS